MRQEAYTCVGELLLENSSYMMAFRIYLLVVVAENHCLYINTEGFVYGLCNLCERVYISFVIKASIPLYECKMLLILYFV